MLKKNFLYRLIAFALIFANVLLLASCIGSDGDEKNENNKGNATDKEPYTLTFVSNNDGTCYVSEITVDPEITEKFVLEIPEKSPDGDKVTEVRFSFASSAPRLISKKDFDEILEKLIDKYVEDESITLDTFYSDDRFAKMPYEVLRFVSFYVLKDLNNCKAEEEKEALLNAFPICARFPVYVIDPSAVAFEHKMLARTAFDIGYTSFDLDEDHKYTEYQGNSGCLGGEFVKEIVFASSDVKFDLSLLSSCINLEKIETPSNVASIPEGAFAYSAAKEIVISEGVTSIGNYAFRFCTELECITIPSSVKTILTSDNDKVFLFDSCESLKKITFTGTKEEWSALGISVGCTVICSDGEYSVE